MCIVGYTSYIKIIITLFFQFSNEVKLTSIIRQGSVLAPILFSVFVDELLIELTESSNLA